VLTVAGQVVVAMAVRRRITQDTFDAAVEENMKEFGSTLVEALADTVAQFTSMGVDLENVVQDGSTIGRAKDTTAAKPNPLLEAVGAVKEAAHSAAFVSTPTAHAAFTAACGVIQEACARDAAAKTIAGSHRAVQNVVAVVRACHGGTAEVGAAVTQPLLTTGFDTLRVLAAGHNDNRAAISVSLCRTVVEVAGDDDAPLPLRRWGGGGGAIGRIGAMCPHRSRAPCAQNGAGVRCPDVREAGGGEGGDV